MFSTLVATLREEGYINDIGDAVREHTLEVYSMLSDLITPEIKLTIESVSMPAETNAQPETATVEEKDE
ncbi:Glycerol-3-phosphate acyltransferase [compost metagenome]